MVEDFETGVRKQRGEALCHCRTILRQKSGGFLWTLGRVRRLNRAMVVESAVGDILYYSQNGCLQILLDPKVLIGTESKKSRKWKAMRSFLGKENRRDLENTKNLRSMSWD